jgi:signal transduction histidine kinase
MVQIFGSIKLRFVLFNVSVVCLALPLLILAVYNSVQAVFDTSIDQQLQQTADEVRAFFDQQHLGGTMLTPSDIDAFTSVFGALKPTATPGPYPAPSSSDSGGVSHLSPGLTYLQIVTTDGMLVDAANNPLVGLATTDRAALLALIHGSNPYNSITLVNKSRLRVLSFPIKVREQTKYYVQVVRSLQEVDTFRSQILVPFVIGGVLTGFILIALLVMVTDRIFNPIEKITKTAYQIGVSGDLSQRINPDVQANDEISRLGRAFDVMLERLETSFKMQRQFIADSSHELRTPLTVIRGNLDLLKRNPDPQNQAESLLAIEKEAGRMQRLVQDLLLLAQTDARQVFEVGPVQLDTVVLEVYKETKVLADVKRQSLKLTHFEAVTVDGDSDRLKRALVNLVENAIKYTPEEGSINISLFKGTKWARVEVADNGIGIAIADQSHIFDRFFRVDKARSRSSGGTGLGLAIVKHIIEGHGGRISLKSEPGHGTTFTVWLHLDLATDAAVLLDADENNAVDTKTKAAEHKATPEIVEPEQLGKVV